MEVALDSVLAELKVVISQLGEQGGCISPSVYDTAQLIRFYPAQADVEEALTWILEQQGDDGGWGEPTAPLGRDIPTLAAVLAIYTYRHDPQAQTAMRLGLDYLRRNAHQWCEQHIDAIPIAAEMILPTLLQEAAAMGLNIDQAPYARLSDLRHQKLVRLAKTSLVRNSAPTYSWEALRMVYTPEVFDPIGGIGHSPAATAMWLRVAHQAGANPELCAQAEDYLARAQAATGTGISGVVPVVYPITGFELSYGLYALLLTGLLDHPALQSTIQPQLDKLAAAVQREHGLSFGEGFVPDVDDTAVAVVVLNAAGYSISDQLVRRFWQNDHFFTYSNELNPSVFSNAHALHALSLSDQQSQSTEQFLARRQEPNGRWHPDKWHTSWRGTTMEVVAALRGLDHAPRLRQAEQALLTDQRSDGSWGSNTGNGLETTYSAITLHLLYRQGQLSTAGYTALQHTRGWMAADKQRMEQEQLRWLGKEVYSPRRVDKLYKLATLATLLQMTDAVAVPITITQRQVAKHLY